MDTLEFTLDDASLETKLQKRLKECGTPAISHRDKDGTVRKTRRGYDAGFCYYVEGRPFFFACSPRHRSLPQIVVEIHCSQFSNIEELLSWLKLIFQEDYDAVLTAPITRLDCCIDVCVPFDTIKESLYQPRVCSVDNYRNNYRGFYIGKSGAALRTYAYEKAVPFDTIDYKPIEDIQLEKNGKVLCTRIEVRFRKEKLPISSLSEVTNLRVFNPFAHLQLNQIDNALIRTSDGKPPYMVLAFQKRCQDIGAQAARKEFNQSGNFSKTIGRFLGKLELDLQQAWSNRVARFFGDSTSSTQHYTLKTISQTNKGN